MLHFLSLLSCNVNDQYTKWEYWSLAIIKGFQCLYSTRESSKFHFGIIGLPIWKQKHDHKDMTNWVNISHRFVNLCICWDTPSENTAGLWQLQNVSSMPLNIARPSPKASHAILPWRMVNAECLLHTNVVKEGSVLVLMDMWRQNAIHLEVFFN